MFRFLLNFIGFLLSFVFTEKIMHEVWHLRNVIYSSIVRCHFKSIGKGGRFCYPPQIRNRPHKMTQRSKR